MAVNKVVYGATTLMDVTDTTAEASDVIEGQAFYAASGLRTTGTLGDATQSTHGLMSSTDKSHFDELYEFFASSGLGIDAQGYITQTL